MRRTVTRDTELRGTRLAAGDKVTMWPPRIRDFLPAAFTEA
jgi:cytochrome P450